ncbi:unnamed protein product [Rotaria magnacalcarata]|uniref:Cytoplasmic dynein 2 light intermediate chain 1 n=1 Tax=Rotaria magnacalcarata TaxID=392030 RepID=A0A816MVX9_9BILA|nr:unnamed protein product [Rotaria magnacalcarata]CAF2059591.1 unnamed protein product [Rotaria magnacalcarata]CAF2246933.1 unnamed protein product [Rotaria magnacalcarata]CAF3751998.1 unnamed protein product [Rotaria magnacalcarata]CAF3908127.1 unnamed protein product [Rotaria magnacalcarata]
MSKKNQANDDKKHDDDFYGGRKREETDLGGGGGGGKSLWDAAREIAASREKAETLPTESNTILFVGSRTGGKTTMILRYLERTNEAAKPTIALDYNYAKKPKTIDTIGKDIGHIWELGDGTSLTKLIDVVLTAETIGNASVVLVLDLSQPQELWNTYQILYDTIAKRVKYCISEAAKQNPNIKEKLKESILKRLGSTIRPEKHDIEPLRIPLLIIGSKYDLFQTLEPDAKKSIIKTLRFLTYYHGATLMSCSEKQESVVHLKSMMNHFLFDTELPNKQPQIDYQKPLYVKSGSETPDQIGPPPIPEYDLGDLRENTPIAVWRAAFSKRFPQEAEKRDPSLTQDYGRDPQYADAAIDAMREQKMAELQRYLTMKNRSHS